MLWAGYCRDCRICTPETLDLSLLLFRASRLARRAWAKGTHGLGLGLGLKVLIARPCGGSQHHCPRLCWHCVQLDNLLNDTCSAHALSALPHVVLNLPGFLVMGTPLTALRQHARPAQSMHRAYLYSRNSTAALAGRARDS